jgi:hypothetical protein
VQSPFGRLFCKALALDVPAQWRQPLSCDVDVGLGLALLSSYLIRGPFVPTSCVSRTLTTPGCRRVRSFRSALRARGNRDLFAVMSKEKMLHLDPSS